MRPENYSTVFTSHNAHDAEVVLKFLKQHGLHPADLRLTAPVAAPGTESTFPVEVPSVEADHARSVLHGA